MIFYSVPEIKRYQQKYPDWVGPKISYNIRNYIVLPQIPIEEQTTKFQWNLLFPSPTLRKEKSKNTINQTPILLFF